MSTFISRLINAQGYVAKGAVVGHPFEGNQYTEAKSDISFGQSNLQGAIGKERGQEGRGGVADGDHMWDAYHALEQGHRAMAELHRQAAEKATGEEYAKHVRAQGLHERAASASMIARVDADKGENSIGSTNHATVLRGMSKMAQRVLKESQKATQASESI
jgi:hypothetical protein